MLPKKAKSFEGFLQCFLAKRKIHGKRRGKTFFRGAQPTSIPLRFQMRFRFLRSSFEGKGEPEEKEGFFKPPPFRSFRPSGFAPLSFFFELANSPFVFVFSSETANRRAAIFPRSPFFLKRLLPTWFKNFLGLLLFLPRSPFGTDNPRPSSFLFFSSSGKGSRRPHPNFYRPE